MFARGRAVAVVGGGGCVCCMKEGVCAVDGGGVGDCAIKIVGERTNAPWPKDGAAIRAADEGDERRRS
jgi:hypothetical protein